MRMEAEWGRTKPSGGERGWLGRMHRC